MPLQAGSLMVVVRAQDFASRTLRRVGAEMHGLSRAQRIQAMREMTMYQKSSALSSVALAESNMRRLSYVKEAASRQATLSAMTQAMTRYSEAQSKVMRRGRFKSGIDRASIREFQNASAAIKSYGLEGVLAARRLKAARAMIDQRRTTTGKAPTAAMARELANADRGLKTLGATGAAQAVRFDKLNAQVTRFDQTIQRLPVSLQRAARNQTAFGDALFRGNRQLERAYKGLSDATRAEIAFNSAMKQMPIQRIHDVAHAMGGIGRTFQLFGAVGTAFFGLAAKAAADFSKATSLASTQVTRIGAGFKEAEADASLLRSEILKLAKEYPYSAKEMADATYEIFSSTNVQNINQGMALLEAFSRVAVAGQVDLATATKASITVLNTFRGSGDNIVGTLNRMFAIVRYGRMRFSDFAAMLPKVAAAAYASGQTLDDVSGIMAQLTRKTGDAQTAATQISRAFDVFTRKEFRVGIKALGVDIEDATGRMLPLPEVLGRIWAKWGKELASGGRGAERFIQIVTRASKIAGKGLLSTTEARRFFRFLFADFEGYTDLQKKVTKDNTEFSNSFRKMMADPGVQFDIFIARIKAAFIVIGQAAIPMFAAIGKHISNFIDWWENVKDTTKGSIIQWGVLISVLTLVSGVLLALGGVFISVALGMGRVAAMIFRFAAGLMGLSKIIGAGGRSGLIARLFVMYRLLTLMAAIGVITIGVNLEQRGGGWKLVGKFLETGGIGALLKRAGVSGAKRFPMAAVMAELIWPDDTAMQTTANNFLAKVAELDDHVQKTVQGRRRRKAVLKAQSIFLTTAARSDFATARTATLAYLKKMGISLGDVENKAGAAAGSWNSFLDEVKKAGAVAATNKILKTLGWDEQTLEQFDQLLDESANAVADWRKQLTMETARAGDTAVDNLRNMYMQMEQVNQEAFGQLFQGPWLTSETFDLAKEWGIMPGINDLIIDLKEQNALFARWRTSLDKLIGKGLPKGFIDELQKMGPEEGQSIIDAILGANPKKVQQLISEWKKKNNQIQDATKMDFTQEITAFKKAGGNMGRAMIEGFEAAGVGTWFDSWVKTTFPNVINAAVAVAVADWKAQNPAPNQPGKPGLGKPKPTVPKTTSSTTKDDHSKTITVNVYPEHGQLNPANPEVALVMRKAAFAARNAMKSIF